MAKKAQTGRTPPHIIWWLIDAEMTAQAVSRAQNSTEHSLHVGKIAKTSEIQRACDAVKNLQLFG